ncbi:hypothetical protein CYMTET_31227 [Cymbomonas tetramitiformis]|uniref:Reverse transcriptase RNase H-like domain-containing protein n=1 Tax=Cymbomonas tetramitiformis TaxID=36881 RepID=A0AAE0KTC7_9CHLO|nr:hypothetical protein CYMTET_31227 [Cymbomonas tetramitiformis]
MVEAAVAAALAGRDPISKGGGSKGRDPSASLRDVTRASVGRRLGWTWTECERVITEIRVAAARQAADLARVKHEFGRHPAGRLEPWEFELVDDRFPACKQEQCGLEELHENRQVRTKHLYAYIELAMQELATTSRKRRAVQQPRGSDGEDSEGKEKKRALAKARFGSLRTATDEELRREAIVVEAMSTPSCTPSVSEYQCSTARLLWDLKEHTLGSQQKKYLERAGGGHGVSQGWIHRYTDLETFFSDLAICSLKQQFLENVHDRTKSLKQDSRESASEFFSRINSGPTPNPWVCPAPISLQQLLYEDNLVDQKQRLDSWQWRRDKSTLHIEAAWGELTPNEQREARRTATAGSSPELRSWEQLGIQPVRTREGTAGHLFVADTEVGTIPGTGGDVGPGVLDACHLIEPDTDDWYRWLSDADDALLKQLRQFSAAEQNYSTGERELGALHHCTTVTWRHYLIFTNFRLQGDHRPLEWLMEPGRELSRRQARWYMDLVEVGVPRMEYIKGALLLVPDALSRRPDFKDKDVREGLREAGVLDPVSDLPTNPLSALDTEEFFEIMPPPSRPSWAQEIDSWLAAVDTLVEAEEALEAAEAAVEDAAQQATLAFKSRLPPLTQGCAGPAD